MTYKVVAYADKRSGYQGAIYQRVDTGEIVVAYRGTEFDRELIKDGVLADGGMVAKRTNSQMADALELTQDALDGLPLSVSTHAANHHEVTLVQLSFDFYLMEAKPGHLIGDRAYHSDPLDAALAKEGVNLIAPHRKNRKRRKTQDGRQLRRYARRWLVERFFTWMQWKRRLLTRWEFYAKNFLGFVQLAAMTVLLRRI